MDQSTREFFGLTEGTDRFIVTTDGRRACYRIDRILLNGGNVTGLRLIDQNDRTIAMPWAAVLHVEVPKAAQTAPRRFF